MGASQGDKRRSGRTRWAARCSLAALACPLISLDLWKSLSEQEKKWLTQPLLDHEEDIYAYHFWIYRGAKYGIEATLNAGVKRIEWSEEDNESFKETWYEALWDYIEENMKSQDFDRFEKLVGHK